MDIAIIFMAMIIVAILLIMADTIIEHPIITLMILCLISTACAMGNSKIISGGDEKKKHGIVLNLNINNSSTNNAVNNNAVNNNLNTNYNNNIVKNNIVKQNNLNVGNNMNVNTNDAYNDYNDKYVEARKLHNNYHGHDIDTGRCEQIHPDVLKYFNEGISLPITHLSFGNTYDGVERKLRRILDSEAPTMQYVHQQYAYKNVLHWGQLKLMLGEMEFLNISLIESGLANAVNTKLASMFQECGIGKSKPDVKYDRIIFIYVGAAPGHHIGYMATLYPDVYFELYDPNPFVVDETDHIKVHQQFFTHIDAKEWFTYSLNHKNHYMIFHSDIRVEPSTEAVVKEDMDRQFAWWRIFNPQLTLFKFRLPWTKGTTHYPKGDIYIQPYAPRTSTETRLLIRQNAPIIEYDHTKYEEQCFYHNRIARSKAYMSDLLGECTIEKDGIDNCYDCSRYIQIVYEYLLITQGDANITVLRDYLMNIQNTITGEHNILSQTIRSINEQAGLVYRYCYRPCQNRGCQYCYTYQEKLTKWKGRSLATHENMKKNDVEV